MESKENKVRTFIAIPVKPSRELNDFLLRCQEELSNERIKWVDISQIHFTLKFLGDVNEFELANISKVLTKTLSGVQGFEYSLSGTGTFGRKKNPGVIWCGVDNQDAFRGLKQKICSLPGVKDENEKEFIPHLTLGRIKYLKDHSKLQSLISSSRQMDFGTHRADRVVLFKSDLKNTGPVYSEITAIDLV